jgi:PEP-CTERM motif
MQIFSKYVFIAVLATLPIMATASVNSPSFSCTSNFVVSFENGYQASCDGDFTFDQGTLFNDKSISIKANGLLNVGEQAIFTAPNILLTANEIVIDGRLNALGGSVELQGSGKVALNSTAIIDLRGHVLPKPVNVNDHWGVFPAKIELLPRDFTISNFNALAYSTISLGGNISVGGTEIVNMHQSNKQHGQLVLSDAHISVASGGNIIQLAAIRNYDNVGLIGSVVSQVPEPSSLSLLAMGLFCIVTVVLRKSKKTSNLSGIKLFLALTFYPTQIPQRKQHLLLTQLSHPLR